MNSPTITMEKSAAAAKLEEYADALERNPKAITQTDRDIVKGYRVLAKGGRLVDVNQAIIAGGLNLAGQPRLAISRSHVQKTYFKGSYDGSAMLFWHEFQPWKWGFQSDKHCWKTKSGDFGEVRFSGDIVSALVPFIPPAHRPQHKLENYFVLWEANWFPEPPRDPYLLRPICGSLMEIVAEWDVTDLELAAVRQSMRRG